MVSSWHSSKHNDNRIKIKKLIKKSIIEKKPKNYILNDNKLEIISKKLEIILYKRAIDYNQYSDLDTLDTRLREYAIQVLKENS